MSVLIVGYRRSREIEKAIQNVAKFKPKRIYLAMDGPKDEYAKKLCLNSREIALKTINWECTINTFFSSKNTGTGFMLKAIDWFFEHEKHGLILEDDVLIHPEFTNFANHYIHNEEIGCISACTFEKYLGKNWNKNTPGFLSKIPSIWGWYGTNKTWNEFRKLARKKTNPLIYFVNLKKNIGFWQSLVIAMCLDYIDQGKLDGWDYEFAYFLIVNKKYILFPSICMSTNIGNSDLAEHCQSNEEISPILSNKSIKIFNFKKRNKFHKEYMRRQTLNIMMKNEYKIQALKGVLKYIILLLKKRIIY